MDRSRIRICPSPQAAATSDPSALNDGPQAPSPPERLETRLHVDASHTFNVPSSPVEASIDPSGLKATSFTSPSCPWNERTRSPVSESLMSIRPESSGPSVTKTPRGAPGQEAPESRNLQLEPGRRRPRGGARPPLPGEPARPVERVVWTASMASKMLSSGSTSRLATEAAASSRACAIRASRDRPSALVLRDDGQRTGDERRDAEDRDERRAAGAATAARAPPRASDAPLRRPPSSSRRSHARRQVPLLRRGQRDAGRGGPGVDWSRAGRRGAGSSRRARRRPIPRRTPRAGVLGPEVVAGLVDPASEPSPSPQQRLVGDLDGRLPRGGIAVEREQPVTAERFDHRRRSGAGS